MGYFFYMEDLDRVITNIKNLDPIEILVGVLNQKAVKDFLIFQNTENQLRLGLDSKGNLLELYKTFSYASFKQRSPGRKASFGVPDLHLSGVYFRSFNVEILKDATIVIDSDTQKPDRDLADQYGKDSEGIMDRNFDDFIDFIQPLYADGTEEAIYK